MPERRRPEQCKSFQDRLSAFAEDARDQAANLPPGIERDNLLRKARQAETASNLTDWLNSPGLQRSK